MALAEGIRTRLLAVAGVTSLVPLDARGVRAIYCGDSPQYAPDTRIEIHELNLDPMVTFDGTSGMRSASIDIDCKDVTQVLAHGLAAAVETGFNDFSGTSGDVTVNAVILEDRSDSTEQPATGKEHGVYVTTLDYQVQHTLN